jgi:hypothetical protein
MHAVDMAVPRDEFQRGLMRTGNQTSGKKSGSKHARAIGTIPQRLGLILQSFAESMHGYASIGFAVIAG